MKQKNLPTLQLPQVVVVKRRDEMNAKRVRFANEYLVDLNATAAAKRAGYSIKSAYSQGQRLLNNAEVKKMIANGIQERGKRLKITQDNVVKELSKVAFSNICDVMKWNSKGIELVASDKVSDEVQGAISSVEITESDKNRIYKVRLHDKLNALDKLAKHMGLYEKSTKVDVDEVAQTIHKAVREIDRMMCEKDQILTEIDVCGSGIKKVEDLNDY